MDQIKKIPKVSLLMKSIERAKDFSSFFRNIGIIPSVYENLDSIWNDLLNDPPALVIVDVSLMKNDIHQIRNHPCVLDQRTYLSYYYTQENKNLLQYTYDTFHIGLVSDERSIKGQLKNTLNRLNHFIQYKSEKDRLSVDLNLREKQVENLVKSSQKDKESLFYADKLISIFEDFESKKSLSTSFFESCGAIFDSIDEIEEFALLELSCDNQKLISPKVVNRKFRNIPDLWAGRSLIEGIEFSVQNMANQVGLDILGGNLMSLLIKGTKTFPEKMIFLKLSDSNLFSKFNWNQLEQYLSGIYCYFVSKKSLRFYEFESESISAHSFLESLDDNLYATKLKTNVATVDLNFKTLKETTLQYKNIRFFWNRFIQSFSFKLKSSIKIPFKMTIFGVDHIVFSVSSDKLDIFFSKLKEESRKFPYWKFFENVDAILVEDLSPCVKMVPSSSYAYLEHLNSKESGKSRDPQIEDRYSEISY